MEGDRRWITCQRADTGCFLNIPTVAEMEAMRDDSNDLEYPPDPSSSDDNDNECTESEKSEKERQKEVRRIPIGTGHRTVARNRRCRGRSLGGEEHDQFLKKLVNHSFTEVMKSLVSQDSPGPSRRVTKCSQQQPAEAKKKGQQ
ncbi:unnamed protein product [Caenorhabditis nigoni]